MARGAREYQTLSSTSMSPFHLVALPYPGRGHINPMLNLCKNLIRRTTSITITFVITEEWLGFLRSDPHPPPGIRYATIPNVIPSELVRGQDMTSFVKAVQNDMTAPCDQLLEQMEQQPDMILADCCLIWSVEIGSRRNIPVVLFSPMSATVFTMFTHIHLLKQNGHFPIDLKEMADVRVDYIPGLSPCPLSAFPTVMYGKGLARLDTCLEAFKVVSKSNCLLLCSVFDLEPHAAGALKSEFQIPIYSVGPSFNHSRLKEMLHSHTEKADDYCIEWLNKQEPNSVLYISFGSFCSISEEQMDELAAGLVQSGVKFMWIARGDTPRLHKICGNDGLVVRWCDQLRVLSHCAVGGFLTHCGWSSTQEGLFTGVPFLTFPLQMDQETNSKLIIDDFKVGWRLKGPTGADKVVNKDEISRVVKRFMDSDSSEVQEMRLRADELRNRCVRAVNDAEGSYEVNFNGFVEYILSFIEQKLHN